MLFNPLYGPFKANRNVTALCLASAAVLYGCGGSSNNSSPTPPPTGSDNKAPVVETGSLRLKSGKEKTLQLSAKDEDGDALTYSIKTQPSSGTASIDDKGVLTYNAVADGTYEIEVTVSDGKTSVPLKVTITVANTAPVAKNAQLALPVFDAEGGVKKASFKVSASDADKDTLSYSIKTQPAGGSASVDATGQVTIDVSNAAQTDDKVVVAVSDGEDAADMTLSISRYIDTGATDASDFKSQFYKVTNPDTTNSQVVHYNVDSGQQTVIKSDVVLGSHVFVVSGVADNGQLRYTNREYGIFQDPGASRETRTANDGKGGTYEYQFYTDHILKAFDANNTANERVIFSGDSLSNDLKNAGINVIDASTKMLLNEQDISNSYVRLKAYDKLADSLKKEVPEEMLHLPITVRLSDGAHTEGHPLALIKENDGRTRSVLLSYLAPHKRGEYPQDNALRKRLQVCDAALARCDDVNNADGNYFLLAENGGYVYLTKDKSKTIYAFNKADSSLSEVSGVEYPAAFDHHHHGISLYSGGGHSTGLFRDFFNLLNGKTTVSEGSHAYAVVNYDLDTQEEVAPGPYDKYGMKVYVHKHAMVLKFSGTTGVKVYDNGDGIDQGDRSNEDDSTPRSFHLSVAAVKNGQLLLEAANFLGGDPCSTDKKCMNYVQAWLDTNNVNTPKTAFDNVVTNQELPYLTAFRVPPLVVGDHAYLNEAVGLSTSSRVYTIYKMPLTDLGLGKDGAGVSSVLGRMYFERTSVGRDGTYRGNVLLWERTTGNVSNATSDVVIGNDSDIRESSENIYSVYARSSTDNRAGMGGTFGLKMSAAHGSTPYLVSGEAAVGGSLKQVNHISGSWIID